MTDICCEGCDSVHVVHPSATSVVGFNPNEPALIIVLVLAFCNATSKDTEINVDMGKRLYRQSATTRHELLPCDM